VKNASMGLVSPRLFGFRTSATCCIYVILVIDQPDLVFNPI
jgi:hypothetical protein